MNAVTTPSRFDELEAAVASMPPREFDTFHHFSPGLYGREIRIPAGSMLTGRTHSGKCLNIVCGDISVANEEDGSVRRIVGHEVFESQPGTRRLGMTHAPTIWTCIHANPTNETDPEKLMAMFTVPHVNPLLDGGRQHPLK